VIIKHNNRPGGEKTESSTVINDGYYYITLPSSHSLTLTFTLSLSLYTYIFCAPRYRGGRYYNIVGSVFSGEPNPPRARFRRKFHWNYHQVYLAKDLFRVENRVVIKRDAHTHACCIFYYTCRIHVHNITLHYNILLCTRHINTYYNRVI